MIRRFVLGFLSVTDGSIVKIPALFASLRCKSLTILCCIATPLLADQDGDWEYHDTGTTITITGYLGPGGAVEVPNPIIGKPVTSIGDNAFKFCTRLQSCAIPVSVTTIGSSAFEGCIQLDNVTLPPGLTRIEDLTFSGCRSLVSAIIPTGVTSIGRLAFYGCTSLANLTIPAGVTAIEWSAFRYCDSLQNVEIPASVTGFLAGAFANCHRLVAINVAADNAAFSSVDGVLFDKSRTVIIQYPTAKLGAYVIPSGVTSVAGDACADCVNLTSVFIPASVTGIGMYAFAKCPSLAGINLDAGNPSYSSADGVLFNKTQTSLIQCPGGKINAITLPATVSNIEWWAFIGNRLAAINAEDSNPSFSSIDGILFDKSQTRLIQYPGGRVGPFAIPPEIIDLGEIPVDDCNELTAISVDAAHALYSSVDGVLFNKDRTKMVRFPAGRGGRYTIPAGVTTIGSYAFDDCSRLLEVRIPASVTLIEYQAFRWCSALRDVYFEGDAPVSEFESGFLGSTAVTVHYRSGSKGWGAEYDGVPTEVIDESIYPAASWLLTHGLDYDTDLSQDLNGDGVSLLLAYALNLDPNINLAGSMPAPVLDSGTMSLTFHAARPGITYAVQTSTDLQTWTTEGVSMSALAPDNTRTATVDRTSPVRFLRLVVTD